MVIYSCSRNGPAAMVVPVVVCVGTVVVVVAYVDFNKCRMCTKCVDECPTGALVKVNFPVKKKEE